MDMDTSAIEFNNTLDTPTPSGRRRSKRVNRKWREIEALKDQRELERTLGDFDFDFDLTEEE